MKTKRELRTEMRKLSQNICMDYFCEAGQIIQQKILNSDEYINAKNIFIYISTEREPCTTDIISDALAHGKNIFVPVCESMGIMNAVHIKNTDFKPGYMNIPEPKNIENIINPNELDLMIVPCVSASKSCLRLGHGGGYYDRYSAQTKAVKICLCFEKLISEDIPTENFDIPMDMIVTEKSTYVPI